MTKYYACIDLKSFYASVEAVERGLDPFKVNLVVSDASRGKGAITLAITPAMKNLGIKNRCRLFEIPPRIKYIIAKPRMKLYMQYSVRIYSVYLKFLAREDIHVYSIDECFMDLTPYLKLYKSTPKQLAKRIIEEIYRETGIRATAGIGTNLFQAKVALDITAKHAPDFIGYIDNQNFHQLIAKHRPLTDIWGFGKGLARQLYSMGISDLAGITQYSKDQILKKFGVLGEILWDHAQGIEPTTIQDIQSYKPSSHSISNSQILFENYNATDSWLVLREMIDVLTLDLLTYGYKTNNISLSIGYADDSLPSTHVSRKLTNYTDYYAVLVEAYEQLFWEKVHKDHLIRKVGISFNNLTSEQIEEIDLFNSHEQHQREKEIQLAMIDIKKRFGKNAIFRAISLEDKATGILRNKLVGGHNGE